MSEEPMQKLHLSLSLNRKPKPRFLNRCRWPAWAGRPKRAQRSQRRLGWARAPTRGPRPPRRRWGRRAGRSRRSAHVGAWACGLWGAWSLTRSARLPRRPWGRRAGRSSRSAQVGAHACSGAGWPVSRGWCQTAKCMHCRICLHWCGSTRALTRLIVCSIPPSRNKEHMRPGDQGVTRTCFCIAGTQAAPPSPLLCTPAHAGIAVACTSPAAFGSAITCAAPSPAERLEPRVATPAMLQIPDR